MIAWRHGSAIKKAEGFSPRLASWDRHDHPSQVRLRGYLSQMTTLLGELPDTPLTLHLEVDVLDASRLHRHHDLENYLTPLVRHLGSANFVHVSAVKFVGGGSRLTISHAVPFELPHAQLAHRCEGQDWKAGLRAAIIASGATTLQPGPVEVRQVFHCAPGRNWVPWWKPSGDAMGPVLGEPYADKPFYPNDDRIVSLVLTRVPDASLSRGAFDIALWWRSLTPTQDTERPIGRVVDGAFWAANRLGADRRSVSVPDMHRVYRELWPLASSGQSYNSFAAIVNYQTINMKSRFPKAAEPRAEAAWIKDPMFYRTARGQYQTLTAPQVDRFRRAVASEDPRVYLAEYDALDLVGAPW